MARKPGPMNPDSTAGNARLGTGRGSNAGRSQPIPKGSVPKPKKFTAPAGITVRPAGYTNYNDPSGYGKTFTQTKSGRWLGNVVPDKPLSQYRATTPLKVTNTKTGTSATFTGYSKEEAVKSFLGKQNFLNKAK